MCVTAIVTLDEAIFQLAPPPRLASCIHYLGFNWNRWDPDTNTSKPLSNNHRMQVFKRAQPWKMFSWLHSVEQKVHSNSDIFSRYMSDCHTWPKFGVERGFPSWVFVAAALYNCAHAAVSRFPKQANIRLARSLIEKSWNFRVRLKICKSRSLLSQSFRRWETFLRPYILVGRDDCDFMLRWKTLNS